MMKYQYLEMFNYGVKPQLSEPPDTDWAGT